MKSDTLEGIISDWEIHQGIIFFYSAMASIVGSNWLAIKAWVIEFIYNMPKRNLVQLANGHLANGHLANGHLANIQKII